MTNSEWLNTEQAAAYLGISKPTLYALTSQRKIKFSKPNGNQNFFKREWLDEYMNNGVVKTADEIDQAAADHVVSGGITK